MIEARIDVRVLGICPPRFEHITESNVLEVQLSDGLLWVEPASAKYEPEH
jgi:hypothetical protein